MPANLPPEYFEAEHKYRRAKTPEEKLEALQEMIRWVPHHKGTEKLMVDLKKRLAKLQQQTAAKTRTSRSPYPDHIPRVGAGQITLVGYPNTGKSSLLACLTKAQPVIAEYPGSTLLPAVGMMFYEDIQIQLVDLPPITSETEGWVYNLIHQSDGVLLVVNPASFSPLDELQEVMNFLEAKKIKLGRSGKPKEKDTLPCALCCTHMDIPGTDEVVTSLAEMVKGEFPIYQVSCVTYEGLTSLSNGLYQLLNIIRVYTKKPGRQFEKTQPFILPRGSSVLDLAFAVHQDLGKRFQYARIWGSTAFEGQRVEKTYTLQDGDIVEIHT